MRYYSCGMSIRLTFILEDKRGDDFVPLGVLGVEQDEDQVEAAEERAGQSYVHRHGHVGVVLALRVGGCKNRGSRVQFTHHSVRERDMHDKCRGKERERVRETM